MAILKRKVLRHRQRLLYSGLFLVLITILSLWPNSEQSRNSQLEDILRRGEIVMLTRNSAATYYEDLEGPAGLEYDLAKGFADELGVSLRVQLYPAVTELLSALNKGEGDFIAAGLSITPKRQQRFRFGFPHNESQPLLIYNRKSKKPETIDDLIGGKLGVNEGASYIRYLRDAKRELPDLNWLELHEAGIEDMLQMVTSGELDYSVIDSTDLALNQQFYPNVKSAFAIGEIEQQAWMFQASNDDSLVQRSREYVYRMHKQNRLQELLSLYFEANSEYDPIEVSAYLNQIRDQLPDLRPLFIEAGDNYDFDWRLLAALAYQESHWKQDAVSPTGVRGIMMLTQSTAQHLGVDDREDPVQSIDGGARYLRSLIDSLPERIAEPDRTYMAMAAYNIGMGHLEDARRLTQITGGDPDNWDDVKEHLPLLSRQQYMDKLRYGYARGSVAVRYVENIQSYFEILNWMESRNHPLLGNDKLDT